jgi:hypothetical protein
MNFLLCAITTPSVFQYELERRADRAVQSQPRRDVGTSQVSRSPKMAIHCKSTLTRERERVGPQLPTSLLYCSNPCSRGHLPNRIYWILASCYIRLTLNTCSFVHQCNTFTSYILLIVDMFRPHTAIFRCLQVYICC